MCPDQPAKRRKLSHDAADRSTLPSLHEVNTHEGSELSTRSNDHDETPDEGGLQTRPEHEDDHSSGQEEQNDETLKVKGDQSQPLSKNQLKKLRKRQEWDAGRDYRRKKRKEKLQEKKARKREQDQQEQEERRAQGLDPVPERKPRQRPVRLPVTFLVDCGFDDKMNEKERISLASQLTRSYSDNYRAPLQAHLVFSSWNGLLKERFDTVLNKHYLNWKGVKFTDEDFATAAKEAQVVMGGAQGGKLEGIFRSYASHTQPDIESLTGETSKSPANGVEATMVDATVADGVGEDPEASGQSRPSPQQLQQQAETVYLTADSPHTIETLKPYSTYIIGGLVDKNRHKGICYKVACDADIKTAKLPIGEFMEMQSRFVLATNHVVEIMVRYLECGDWGEAFMKVIPKRKGGKLRKTRIKEDGKDEVSSDDAESDGDHEDHEDEAGQVEETGPYLSHVDEKARVVKSFPADTNVDAVLAPGNDI